MTPKGDRAPTFVKYIPAVVAALVRLGGSGRPDEVRAAIAIDMKLSDEEQLERLPSGVQSRFENQVHWARFSLAKAGYIAASQHGVWTLSDKARDLGRCPMHWRVGSTTKSGNNSCRRARQARATPISPASQRRL